MSDSTRPKSGPDNDNIIDLAERRASRPKSYEQKLDDELGPVRKNVKKRVAAVFTLHSHRPQKKSSILGLRRKPKIVRARSDKKTVLQGLDDIRKKPAMPSISGGKMSMVQPEVMNDQEVFAKMRGCERTLQVFMMHRDEISFGDDYPSVAAAAGELKNLASQFPDNISPTDDGFFREVAKILLKIWKNNFRGRINDERVASIGRLVIEQAPKRKIEEHLRFLNQNPV